MTGEAVDLLAVGQDRFETIMCNKMPLSKGRYYEFLFACILKTVAPESLVVASPAEDVYDHYDALIEGQRVDFTMQQSEKKKRAARGVTLIRFPSKEYHRGLRVNSLIVELVTAAVADAVPEVKIDLERVARLKRRLERYSFSKGDGKRKRRKGASGSSSERPFAGLNPTGFSRP